MLSQSLNILSNLNGSFGSNGDRNYQSNRSKSESSQSETDSLDPEKAKVSSSVWLFYKSGPGRHAICNLCRKNVSHKTSLVNLKEHLKLRHISAYTKYLAKCRIRDHSPSSEDDFEGQGQHEKKLTPLSGILWQFYEKGPNKRATCNLCKASFSYLTSKLQLKMHLKDRHVSAYMTFLAKSAGQSRELLSDFSDSEPLDVNQIQYELSSTSEDDLQLPPKSKGLTPKMYSPIWHFFTVIPNQRGICNLCNTSVSFKSTITNLKNHLKAKHPISFNKFVAACLKRKSRRHRRDLQKESNQKTNLINIASRPVEAEKPIKFPGLVNILPRPTEGLPSTSRQIKIEPLIKQLQPRKKRQINQCLLDLFTNDYQSFRILQDVGFLKFVNLLNPSYKLPSRKTVSSSMIPELFKKRFEEKGCSVKEQAKKVCITVESWTTRSIDYYVTITAHFINDDFEFVTVLLHCMHFKLPCTETELELEFSKVIKNWNLTDKVSFAVINIDPEIKKTVIALGWEYMICYATILNQAVQDSIELFSETINKVKEIALHFTTNKVSSERLLRLQKGSQAKELIYCASSRWNSVIGMLERFCNLQESLNAAISDQSLNLPILTEDEWSTIEQLCVVLGPFEEVTRKMNGEKFLSASMSIIIMHGLLSICDKLKEESFSGIIDKIIDKLKSTLLEHFKDIEHNESLAICTFLDPRFKMPGFADKSAADFIKMQVITMVEALIKIGESFSIKAEITDSPPSKKFSVWEELDKAVKKTPKSSNAANESLNEVDMYLKDEMLERGKCPLDWWKSHRYLYPNLSKLVIEKFHLVVSSVPCERVFSDKGLNITDRRSLLPSTRTEELIFLNCNSK